MDSVAFAVRWDVELAGWVVMYGIEPSPLCRLVIAGRAHADRIVAIARLIADVLPPAPEPVKDGAFDEPWSLDGKLMLMKNWQPVVSNADIRDRVMPLTPGCRR